MNEKEKFKNDFERRVCEFELKVVKTEVQALKRITPIFSHMLLNRRMKQSIGLLFCEMLEK